MQNPNSMSKYIQELQEQEERRNASKNQTIQYLTSNAAIQEYFSQFDEHSVKRFMEFYADLIFDIEEYGDRFQKSSEDDILAYFERAQNCLKEIQLKKLFDLRCEWGAGYVSVPEIEISYDFELWACNIFNCSFISPISLDDFNLYLQYAESDSFNEPQHDWRSYERLREVDVQDDSEEDEFPEWFLYHNMYTDAAEYISMPDIRGKREDFYIHLHNNAEEEKNEPPIFKKPLQPGIKERCKKTTTDFVKSFETPRRIRLFENYVKYSPVNPFWYDADENAGLDDSVEEIMYKLSGMKDIRLPVEANADWRKGLIKAWEKFELEQVRLTLPEVYADYLFKTKNNIKFPEEENFYTSLLTTIRHNIINGRRINGEPADLNF